MLNIYVTMSNILYNTQISVLWSYICRYSVVLAPFLLLKGQFTALNLRLIYCIKFPYYGQEEIIVTLAASQFM
jgi:hypothetical protein